MGAFEAKISGNFSGVLRWEDLDRLWDRIGSETGWHISAAGAPAPEAPASREDLGKFLAEIAALLRSEHPEEYCGIVYVDDPEAPSMAKIYDPSKIGSSCSRGKPYPPGWILSKDRPSSPIDGGEHVDGNRKRWWASLFGN